MAFPFRFISNHKKLKILEEFAKLVNTSLSLENFLENSIEMEKLKIEHGCLKESFKNMEDSRFIKVNQGNQKHHTKNYKQNRSIIKK